MSELVVLAGVAFVAYVFGWAAGRSSGRADVFDDVYGPDRGDDDA